MLRKKVRLINACCWVVLLALILLCLSGCNLHNEILDDQMNGFVSCLDNDTPDELYVKFAPNVWVDQDEYYEWYHRIKDIWQPITSDKIKLQNLSVEEIKNDDGTWHKYYKGEYIFDYGDKDFLLTLSYQQIEGSGCITDLQFKQVTKNSGTFIAVSIVLTVLVVILLIYTIIDIVKKKPKRYVMWIIIVLFLTLIIPIDNTRFGIPIGCIIYWSLRKKLYRSTAGSSCPPPSNRWHT